MKQNDDEVAYRTYMIMVELYKRNIWNDEKTANILSQGVFNKNWKIVYMACRYLIDSADGTLFF